VHHEVPSGSDSPHAIQARSTRRHNGWDKAYYDQTAQGETMMAFTAMLSELYDAFRRKIGADEPPAKTAAEAVVIEDARFRSIDGKFDALNQPIDALSRVMDQRFDALNHAMDQRSDVLSRALDQRFGAFGQGMDQRFGSFGQAMGQRLDTLHRMIDERFATVDRRFAAMDQHLAARDALLVRLETNTTKTATEMDAQLARLVTKTAREFRHLRWGLGIVIALVLGLVTKVILDWTMPDLLQ
jgi:DNA anti-recombination protein RmuC